MTSYTWILLILASLAATRAQDFDLSDALSEDDPPPKPTVKPVPPKNPDADLDLLDALDLDPKKPAVVPPKSGDDPKKPAVVPPKSGDDPKKPAVVPPKSGDGGLDLSDALGPDDDPPKKPAVPKGEGGTGGGSLSDKDLSDVFDEGEYKPDKGRIGGGGADPGYDDQSGGASEQPQDLNHQQWLQLIKMLGDNIPEVLSDWIAQFKQVVEPLLEQFRGLLNITEEKAEL
ncbi:CD99 molecule isoform X2 [Pseudorasbora parva]|uniref:CD99 molecule isoform X2 n=1 Tax=Pseudorasbora parva TaxID=51549 RepID=UPI00351EE0D1